MRYARAIFSAVIVAFGLLGLYLVDAQTPAPVPLLPNQYAGMPPIANSTIQYCKHVCTENLSGSIFGGARDLSNICQYRTNRPDGSSVVYTGPKPAFPDGIELDTLKAPDGVSECRYEAPQCTVSNGCLDKWIQCMRALPPKKVIPSGVDPCWRVR